MKFFLLFSGIFLLGAACTSDTLVQELPEQQVALVQNISSYDLFADDPILFFNDEEIVFTTNATSSTSTIEKTNTSTLSILKTEQKKKIIFGHGTIVIPKKELPPLPPKTISPQKVEPVEEEEETEEEYAEEDVEYETEEDDYSNLDCEPDWECSEWSNCTASGKKTYSCVDLNECEEDYIGSESCKAPTKLTKGPYNVAVTGTNATCRNNTIKAMNLLKTLPSYYQFFITYVGEVNCIPQASRMDVYKEPPRFEVGYVTAGGGDIWYASVLVHEACHSKQYRDYVYANNSFDVPQDLYYGYNAEYACNQTQKKALIELNAEQYLIDSMDDMSFEWWSLSEEDQTW